MMDARDILDKIRVSDEENILWENNMGVSKREFIWQIGSAMMRLKSQAQGDKGSSDEHANREFDRIINLVEHSPLSEEEKKIILGDYFDVAVDRIK